MYRSLIIGALGQREADPRHIEAWMRLGHSTLDGLSPSEFAIEVDIAFESIKATSIEDSEELAISFGF